MVAMNHLGLCILLAKWKAERRHITMMRIYTQVVTAQEQGYLVA